MDMIQMNFLARSHGLRRVAGLWPCIFLTLLGRIEATTITAASPLLGDVISAVSSAVDGDTVVIPGGTATWTSGLAINKAITLQGNGIGNTIIKDGMTSNTLRLLECTLVSGKPTRITGIEFQGTGSRLYNGVVTDASGGVMGLSGQNQTNGQTLRVDHCKFNNLQGNLVINTVIGVIDHNQILSHVGGFFAIWDGHWGGQTTPFGDISWASPINFGGPDFLFIEDNTFVGTATSLSRSLTDGYSGARFVVRHNDIQDGLIANHGLDSTGRYRSGLAIELYNNTFHETTVAKGNFIGGIRGGVILMHDNTVAGYSTEAEFRLDLFRMFSGSLPVSWPGGATGTNPWDKNVPGGPFYTGTAAVASSATTGPRGGSAVLVTVTGSPNWTTNQWVGYSVNRTTNLAGVTTQTFSEIISSGSNTLTYANSGGFGNSLSFVAGDSLQIWKVFQAMDMPGVSGGQLVTAGYSLTPMASPPLAWNDQVITPCYSWNNTNLANNTPVDLHADSAVIALGTYYFNNTKMPGYTPYTYPHPLVSGATPTPTPPPAAPTNLRITGP